MKQRYSYHDDLITRLKNPNYAMGYLKASFDDPNPRVFLLALKDVIEATGGITKFSRLSKIPRITLYRILSKRGNPEFFTLANLLHTLGLKLTVIKEKNSSFRHAA